MNSKLVCLSALGLAAGMAAGCHDNNAASPAPVVQAPQSLDTAQVLALAQVTSEASEPIVVNGGALTLNDTSETSAPIAVGAM
jgi:hypothetical protein